MTAGAAADRRDEVFPSSGARVVLGPWPGRSELGVESGVLRETSWTLGISRFEYYYPSKQREQSISVRLQSSASGRGEKSGINSVCGSDICPSSE